MTVINHMPIDQFRAEGWVQEINRRLLHPAGLALEVTVEEDGTERISGVWGYRDDPEGIVFGDGELDSQKYQRVEDAIAAKDEARRNLLGYVIQPVE